MARRSKLAIAAVAAAATSVLLSLAGRPPLPVRLTAAILAGVTSVAAALWWASRRKSTDGH